MGVTALYCFALLCIFCDPWGIFQFCKKLHTQDIEFFKLVTLLHKLAQQKKEANSNFLFFWSNFPILFQNLKTLISGSLEPCGGKIIGKYPQVKNYELNPPETSVFDFSGLFELFWAFEKKSPILFWEKSCLIFFSPKICGGKIIWCYRMILLSFLNNPSP